MQYKVFLLTMAFSLVSTHASFGQGPVGDEVIVTFDRTVQVGSHSLPAGKYTIRQVTSASNPRVLEFTSDNGTKLDATVAAIPILQNTPPSKTRVILDDEGGSPRVARIWVQGKSYGYEFPGKGNATRTVASSVGLQGTFTAQAPPAVAQTVPTPAPPVTQSAPPADSAVVAQNRPAETPAPAPQPPQSEAAPAPSAQTPPPSQSADRSATQSASAPNTTREVPTTALGWMQVALLGMALASVGAFLFWRERSSR